MFYFYRLGNTSRIKSTVKNQMWKIESIHILLGYLITMVCDVKNGANIRLINGEEGKKKERIDECITYNCLGLFVMIYC